MSTGDILGGRLLCAVKEAEMPDPPSGWSSTQRKVVLACYLGWTLDAFDFFLLVFVLKDIAAEFHTEIGDVTIAIPLTLAMRPLGAFLFGRAADRYGRRPTLMVNVVLYSLLEFASGFAPSLTALIVLRALYGIAMGGEWGAPWTSTVEPHHLGAGGGLVDKHQSRRVKRALLSNPASSRAGDVGPSLLRGPRASPMARRFRHSASLQSCRHRSSDGAS